MNFLPLIEAKREGKTLTAEQTREYVHEFTAGEIPDYQMSAMLMAIYFRGLNTEETTALTLAMRDSGDVLKFPADSRPIVDKHSTGGIGDKVSLPLAPLLACLGFRVPMISGRGLGITGGTLDKLDSIPGFQTLLPAPKIIQLVQRVGCVICGQTQKMVPADRKTYALRDATGTVPSIPLITASILSKKLAESLNALILDVKFGTAAFMPTQADARKLARAMVTLGHQCGTNTRAVLTDMNAPLGRSAGNWLEVTESVACLDGQGPEDLRELVIESAAHLLLQTGKSKSITAARKQAADCLESGAPRKKWDEMIVAQGADLPVFNRKLKLDSTAQVTAEVLSQKNGFISKCDARIIGEVIRDLGGGRFTKESRINHDVGVDRIAKPGERMKKSGALCRVHAVDLNQATKAGEQLKSAFEISAQRPAKSPLVVRVVSA